jgi:transposase
VLTAAILIGHTAGVHRFGSDASLSLLSGTAPIPCSSGKRTQHRLNRGGDRQLNHALHIIAITRAHHDPATKQYRARPGLTETPNRGFCPRERRPSADATRNEVPQGVDGARRSARA